MDVSIVVFLNLHLSLLKFLIGHRSFCLSHLNDHQQQLLGQMDILFHKHNLLREQLSKNRVHSDNEMPEFLQEFTGIDSWERNTLAYMSKIISAEAERARDVIRQIIAENRQRISANEAATSEELDRLKTRLEILSKQLQARIETKDFF